MARQATRAAASGASDGAAVRDAMRAWRRLRSNSDYVADWRANAGPVVQEAPPFPLRRQTVADLEAARWNLLAWEAPWLKQYGAPFWADVPMRDGRALDMGEAAGKTLRRVVVRCGATFWGLRLRDGVLVLRVARGREAEQIWMADGAAFDPRRSGLEIAVVADASPHNAWVLSEQGISGSLAFDPHPESERGFSVTLSQSMGAQASGGMDGLLGRGTLEGLGANDADDGLANRRLELKAGYGFGVAGGRFTATPEAGMALSDSHREMSLGWRLALSGGAPVSMELGLEATRREAANDVGAPEHAVGLRMTARW